MRTSLESSVSERSVALASVLLAVLAAPSEAQARPMDPALSRLVRGTSCGPTSPCLPDRAAYHKLVSQWGAAFGPHTVHEARTTGLSGFAVSLVGAITAIDDSADYWRRGTRGSSDERAGGVVALNSDPDSLLQLYSLEVRKGLGLGLEAASSIGIMPNTSAVSFGADLRLALLEGMRLGGLRYLPDTSLGLGLRRVTGLAELSLGTLALEARMSKPLVVPSRFILTPWLGYQWLRIDADSELVDLTPSTDPLAACGYVGTNVPGMPGTEDGDASSPASGAPASVFDGSLDCRNPGAVDYANTVSFGEADVRRHRVLVGLSFRQELLKVGAELITDIVRPDAAQTDDRTAQALRCDAEGEACAPSPRQWTLALQVGAAF